MDTEEWGRQIRYAQEEADRIWSGLWDDLALTEDETLALARAERDLSRASHARSLQYLLRRWSHFVMLVEFGWPANWGEDYDNDLSVRDILQRLIHAVSPSIQEKVVPLVEPWDARWKAATLRVKEPLWGRVRSIDGKVVHVPNEEIAWWNFRVPKVIWPEESHDWHYDVVYEK